MEKIALKLDNFEGPLDLLLYFIQKKKLDIETLEISQLIDEYLAVLNSSKNDSLQIKVEFLIIASELLEIKALAVINHQEKLKREEELGKRLKEYKLFKELTKEIEKLENIYNIGYSQEDGEKISNIPTSNFKSSSLNTDVLRDTFERILKKYEDEEYLEINIEPHYDPQEVRSNVMAILSKKKDTPIFEILDSCESRGIVVARFLTVLELYKEGKIYFEKDTIRLVEKDV